MMNNITLEHYLILSAIIFSIGVGGLFLRGRNIISILMSIELMLLSINLNFISFSVYLQELSGQIFSIIVLTIAAAETSIGLAILVIHFRNKASINIEDINQLRG